MTLKNRNDIPQEDKWDLTHIFPTMEKWEAGMTAFGNRYGEITSYKGKLGETSTALACLNLMDALTLQIDHLISYAQRRYHLDTKNSASQELQQRVDQLCNQFISASSFISPELT